MYVTHSIVAKLSLLMDLVVSGLSGLGGAGLAGVGWWVPVGEHPFDRSLDLARIPAGRGRAGVVRGLGVWRESLRDVAQQFCAIVRNFAQCCAKLCKLVQNCVNL